MKILGITAYCNNAAACIVEDGVVLAAAREEWYTRVRGDASFPANAIDFCLRFTRLELKEIDAIALHDKPLLRFERLLETHYAFAPKGLKSFLASMPLWIHEKVFLRSLIHKELKKLRNTDIKRIRLLFSEHHLSHAAGAFYASPFREAAILVLDSVGEWATTSICHGHESRIKIIKELRFPNSLGLIYDACASYLGYDPLKNSHALSCLASYGDHHAGQTNEYIRKFREHLVEIKDDGSVNLNQEYFRYTTGDKMTDDQRWGLLFGFPVRRKGQALKQQHYNLALAAYIVIEEAISKLLQETKQLTGATDLCVSGDLVMDRRISGKIKGSTLFSNVFSLPDPGDAGSAIGAALAAYHLYFRQKRNMDNINVHLRNCLLGPEFNDADILNTLEEQAFQYYHYHDRQGLLDEVADLVSQDNIVGIFRGRMEFGPDSFGNRIIIANPASPDIIRRLGNLTGAGDHWMPLAIALAGEVEDHPGDKHPLLTIDPGIEIQTLNKSELPCLKELLMKIKHRTNLGMVLLGNLCAYEEPNACTPADAIRFFRDTDMDYLVMDKFLISKQLNLATQQNITTDCLTL